MKVYTLLRVLKSYGYNFVDSVTGDEEYIRSDEPFRKMQLYFDKDVVDVVCGVNRAIIRYK